MKTKATAELLSEKDSLYLVSVSRGNVDTEGRRRETRNKYWFRPFKPASSFA